METALKKIFKQYKGKRSELIPILQKVQDRLGYLPKEALNKVAVFTRTPDSLVFGVATFYAQFYLSRQGKYKIKVCSGTACHVNGGSRILKTVQRKLGIVPGQTTKDYVFSLERVSCFGSCALAPVLVVNGKVYGRMTPKKAERIIDDLRKKKNKLG